MAFSRAWRSILLVCALCGLATLVIRGQQTNAKSGPGLAGNWEGKCQDDRTFVVLALQTAGNQFSGTVSIANMHGDDEGACMIVTAAPSPAHALKISDVVAGHETLSFRGVEPSNASSVQFELKQIAPDRAELKLLHTPVEKHPWLLVRVQRPD